MDAESDDLVMDDVMDNDSDDQDEEEEEEEEEDDDDDEDQDEQQDDDVLEASDEDEDDTKTKLKKDAVRHKKDMEELKKRDPEFYQYLQKEDAELLNFDMSEEEEEEEEAGSDAQDDSDDQANDDQDDQDDGMFDEGELTTVTMAMLDSWVQQIEKKADIKSWRRLMAAFKTATKMNDEEEREKNTFIYKIVDPAVFNKVLTSTMHFAPIVFDHHLLKSNPSSPRKAKQWTHLQSTIKTYLNNLLYLLRSLTDVSMQYLTVQEAEKCTAYWACFDRLPKDYLKVLLHMYSNMGSSDNVRIQSFLAIRSLASASHHTKRGDKDEPMLDLCLKHLYLEFVRTCKNTNAHTLPSINLMRNLAVDLYGLDQVTSYQQAFVYIRQLAVHLRGAMQTRSEETYKAVYNWQYVHCIDFWANVLATYCQPTQGEDESPLTSLIYPLSQVALGAIRLIPTAQYYPLRFHILKSLASLSKASKVFITLVPYLLDVLNSAELLNKAKPSTVKALDWDVTLRTPKSHLHGRVYQDGIIDQIVETLDLCMQPFYHELSFPEMAIPVIVAVKRFIKKSNNVKGNNKLLKLVHKVNLGDRALFFLT
ncbi:Noc2-domain-containing protein [Hesseltinella vesiculosa]|uniref:Noc2-domain-containing protein n=1 Tax=Hesseltinella vesiculosa TaxID=101127 RepID=A0A1X2G7Y7_9FUNG|nr:Noc2-domain-containing protein [Hesseltinella vesiculosa]